MGAIVGVLILMLLGPQLPAPASTETPDALASVSYGDEGPVVEALNVRLEAAGFHPDEGDEFGRRTRHAVYAFQKHYGLETDGVFAPEMWPLLDVEIALPYRAEQDRVEVDLGKQVLYLVEDGAVTLVVPISSASGGSYRNRSGGWSRASTPEGRFKFDRKVNGWRQSYLGGLYNPFYFTGGYAIHGSYSVPNFPASHGCIRTTIWDMDLLKTRIGVGWTVYVYGQRTQQPAPYTIPTPRPVAL